MITKNALFEVFVILGYCGAHTSTVGKTHRCDDSSCGSFYCSMTAKRKFAHKLQCQPKLTIILYFIQFEFCSYNTYLLQFRKQVWITSFFAPNVHMPSHMHFVYYNFQIRQNFTGWGQFRTTWVCSKFSKMTPIIVAHIFCREYIVQNMMRVS